MRHIRRVRRYAAGRRCPPYLRLAMSFMTQPAYLTLRESEVLRLVARGRTYAQIGKDLGVSPHTVTTHIKNAYRKLGVRSGAAAVMRAVELRLFGEG
jgi:DNA-binding CsgD family transcriptional regulator